MDRWYSPKMLSCPLVLLFIFCSLDLLIAINNHLISSCSTVVSSGGLHRIVVPVFNLQYFLFICIVDLSSHKQMCYACAHTTRSQCSGSWPSALNYWKGNCIICKGHPGTIKERGRGKEHSLISSSLNSNNSWQNCAYEPAEHLGMLNV